MTTFDINPDLASMLAETVSEALLEEDAAYWERLCPQQPEAHGPLAVRLWDGDILVEWSHEYTVGPRPDDPDCHTRLQDIAARCGGTAEGMLSERLCHFAVVFPA